MRARTEPPPPDKIMRQITNQQGGEGEEGGRQDGPGGYAGLVGLLLGFLGLSKPVVALG